MKPPADDVETSDRSPVASKDMRVLFVLPRIVAGGVERVTLNLIEGLQHRNVQCCLALGRCRGELLEEAMSLTAVQEIAPLSKWLFVFGLLRILRNYRPTHIVTAFPDVSMMVLMARALVGSRAAVVVGVHGTLLEAAAKGGWYVRLQYVLHSWLAKWVYRHSSAIVAVSEGVAGDIRDRHKVPCDSIHVIHNPVLSAGAQRRLQALAHRTAGSTPSRIVAVGRLAYEKGFDVLLRAMPAIVAQHDVCLDIYGEGIEQQRLQHLINALGLQKHVCLKGHTLDPLSVIHAADIFVFPSRHEGFGVALVEALACGTQIVASDCPHGPAEILKHGQLGQLVPPEDVSALASAVSRSLSGEVRFESTAMRERAAEFTADASVDRYYTLLASLTGSS